VAGWVASVAALSAALAGLAAGPPARGPLKLVVGFTLSSFHDADTDDAQRALKIWANHVARSLGSDARIEPVLFGTLDEVARAVREKRIDIVGMNAGEYMQIRESVSLEPVMVPEVGGEVYQDVALIARRDLARAGISGLKGRRLQVMRSPSGTGPSVWLANEVMRLGHRSPQAFFSEVKQAQRASQAILAVFFGSAEACFVTKEAFQTASELNPQVGERLVDVASSSKLVGAVIAFRSGVDHADRAAAIELMGHTHETPAGKQVFTLFRMGRLVPFRPEYLEGIEALFRENASLTRSLGRRAP
jgi:ABC-type phosphate/phosphonate transport system substrate-binding protein